MPHIGEKQKWFVIGGRRGLGGAFVRELLTLPQVQSLFVTTRRPEQMKVDDLRLNVFQFDFAQEETWTQLIAQIQNFSPSHVICFSGGGPFGLFSEKAWKDHQWALQVSFLGPAFLLHQLLQAKILNLKQVTYIGSQIAEDRPDPGAASYAAAKHALLGLVSSVQKESNNFKSIDIRLVSPGYMDTEMLPPQSRPRMESLEIADPVVVSQKIYSWLMNPDDANGQLRV